MRLAQVSILMFVLAVCASPLYQVGAHRNEMTLLSKRIGRWGFFKSKPKPAAYPGAPNYYTEQHTVALPSYSGKDHNPPIRGHVCGPGIVHDASTRIGVEIGFGYFMVTPGGRVPSYKLIKIVHHLDNKATRDEFENEVGILQRSHQFVGQGCTKKDHRYNYEWVCYIVRDYNGEELGDYSKVLQLRNKQKAARRKYKDQFGVKVNANIPDSGYIYELELSGRVQIAHILDFRNAKILINKVHARPEDPDVEVW